MPMSDTPWRDDPQYGGMSEDSARKSWEASKNAEVIQHPRQKAPPAQAPEVVLESKLASSFKPRAIRWLWPDRFAIGKLGLIGGLPDKGKGLITCDLFACVTANQPLPCGEGYAPQGSVIYFTAED